jgi:sterol desaturase/sphingolipid hydroxylase (fatty acid hydroxylase superfamily)
MRMIESLSRANGRIGFGRPGERLLVSPSYHRLHHAIIDGHTGPARGCNFTPLLPLWDILFGTADFSRRSLPPAWRINSKVSIMATDSFVSRCWGWCA